MDNNMFFSLKKNSVKFDFDGETKLPVTKTASLVYYTVAKQVFRSQEAENDKRADLWYEHYSVDVQRHTT